MKSERLALLILGLIVLGLPAGALGYQHVRTVATGMPVIELDARLPETGGWQPEVLRIPAGQPVLLRIHGADVLHSFAIGRTGIGPVDVEPGRVTEIVVNIDEPGSYTFFCTRWCSASHWRMRGTLEVAAADNSVPALPREPAPYLALGIDLDASLAGGHAAEHEPGYAAGVAPAERPSAARGAALGLPVPAVSVADTPSGVFAALRADYPAVDDADLWGLVALAWRAHTSDSARALGETLYQRDCVACHGPQGAGDGVMARELPEQPVDWSQPAVLAKAADALLHGKIVRGGMGTGMPGWSEIYSDEETWALVAYLRALQFAP